MSRIAVIGHPGYPHHRSMMEASVSSAMGEILPIKYDDISSTPVVPILHTKPEHLTITPIS